MSCNLDRKVVTIRPPVLFTANYKDGDIPDICARFTWSIPLHRPSHFFLLFNLSKVIILYMFRKLRAIQS